jgi:predicted component of type VI protein secretion system
MRLYYLNKQGEQKTIDLAEKPITIGRSADADVLILDEKASRVHCGIRYWDGDFYIKDLKSKNGTFVNDSQIDIHQLQAGDQIRVGSSVFVFEQEISPGANTALEVMQGEYEEGKGYATILREIVHETDPSAPPRRRIDKDDPEPTPAEPLPDPSAEKNASLEASTRPEGQARPIRRKTLGSARKKKRPAIKVPLKIKKVKPPAEEE